MGRAVEAGPIFVFAYGVCTPLLIFFRCCVCIPLLIAMNVKCRGGVGVNRFFGGGLHFGRLFRCESSGVVCPLPQIRRGVP